MRTIILSCVLQFLFCSIISANSVVIKHATSIKDTYVRSGFYATYNDGKTAVLAVGHGATSSYDQRIYIRFDMSAIPPHSVINSAILHMQPTYVIQGGNSNIGGSNAVFVRRVAVDWTDNAMLWNSQPLTTITDQTSVPDAASTYDTLLANVTAITQYFSNNPTKNYGYCIVLQDESNSAMGRYREFYSSEDRDSFKWPELIVDYTPPVPVLGDTGTVTITQSSYISDTYVKGGTDIDYNFGEYGNLHAGIYPPTVVPSVARTYIHFDQSQVPAFSTITAATLTMQVSNVGGPPYLTTYINRVKQDWRPNGTYMRYSAPYDTFTRISVPSATTYTYQVDVTSIIQYFADHPLNNYGMAITLQDENTAGGIRAIEFYSIEDPTPSNRPMLSISYRVTSTGINDATAAPFRVALYPNPSAGSCMLSLPDAEGKGQLTSAVYDVTGREVLQLPLSSGGATQFATDQLIPGIYLVNVFDHGHLLGSNKLIAQ